MLSMCDVQINTKTLKGEKKKSIICGLTALL